jgi:hypothetical protein
MRPQYQGIQTTFDTEEETYRRTFYDSRNSIKSVKMVQIDAKKRSNSPRFDEILSKYGHFTASSKKIYFISLVFIDFHQNFLRNQSWKRSRRERT